MRQQINFIKLVGQVTTIFFNHLNLELMQYVESDFDKFGEKGTEARIEAISRAGLGQQSEAAQIVLEKRYRRKELMEMGLSYEHSVLIVNKEYEKNN